MDVPGFIQAEEHALRRQIDIGTQQIHHNGQGAGYKIKDPNSGAEEIQKPAAAFFIQHRPQAQHGGAEKAGKHQIRLSGHPVVTVQKAGSHEPECVKKNQVPFKAAMKAVMIKEQRHESDKNDPPEKAVHFGPVLRRGRAEHKQAENQKASPGIKASPAPALIKPCKNQRNPSRQEIASNAHGILKLCTIYDTVTPL